MKANVRAANGLALEWTLERTGQAGGAGRTGGRRGRLVPPRACRPGNCPRVTRLLALAIKLQGMVDRRRSPRLRRSGAVGVRHARTDYAAHEPAQFGPRHPGSDIAHAGQYQGAGRGFGAGLA